MRSSASISTKLSISCSNAMRSASMLRENIAMSSFVGTNPETCISRQFSLSVCLSRNSTNHYLRTSFVSVLKQSINRTIEQIKHTSHVSSKVQERVWLRLTMAHRWQIIGQSIPIYIPLTPLECDSPLVSIRLVPSLVPCFVFQVHKCALSSAHK